MRRLLRPSAHRLYGVCLAPRALSEDVRRREFIFSVLAGSAIIVTAAALCRVLAESLIKGATYHGVSAWLMAALLAVITGLYGAARRRFRNRYPYAFLLLLLAAGTYALWLYGYELPEGLLIYALVTVMAGVMISARGALVMIGCITACLSVLSFLQEQGITHPDTTHRFDPLSPPDIVSYVLLLGVIGVVSWLFSRDLKHSLARAHRSEAALLRQRDELETEVTARTRQLEQAQMEKMLELQRFAEFGRLSATLLHELANPLTSVSLELEQLAQSQRSALVRQMQKGVASMEEYVKAARRQLRDQGELARFDSAAEIVKTVELLQAKARHHRVALEVSLAENARLYGDSVRFGQMLSNLIANAVDAYADTSAAGEKRRVLVTTRCRARCLELIVQDWGSGIPPSELERIFEPFYTTKGVQRGTGIGLAITKRTVEEDFNGRISVKSTGRGGTRFMVRLPLSGS